ncbi:gliding motility protein GldN [Limibacterium fermenti]|uniref:type IX secretion system ring protein PorN/GldN n=1 Tax=Limibacterium fermenti TaxID=3229863 RepID=UPI003A6518D2
MKKKRILFILSAVAFAMVSVCNSWAQETAQDILNRRSNQTAQPNRATAASGIRARQLNRGQEDILDRAKWSRIIYRYLDLSKEANAPLYYPLTPEDGRMNLFSMIFRLLQDGQIKAYEYLDGKELFTDQYTVDFNEFLDRFDIYHTVENGRPVVSDVDIPANEVQGYYLKEAYYFETGTSNFHRVPIAICPVIFRQGDYDAQTVRYPLFWIPYAEIALYALQMPLMTSSLNNTMSGTVDDFFRKHDYDGEIYKAANPRNLAISQYTSTPEEVARERAKIEQQLLEFEKGLWKEEPYASAQQAKQRSSKRQSRKTGSGSSSSASAQTMRDRRY